MSKIEERINASPFLLVDFYAEWCEPCKWLDQILIEVTANFQENLEILKIDIDKETSVGNAYEIRSVPTLILFKNGLQVWRMSGFKGASELSDSIKKFM